MKPIVSRIDPSKWDVARGVTLGGAGLSTAIVFLITQIGVDSCSLSISLFCSSVAIPVWLAIWRVGESYAFFGTKSYGHLSTMRGLPVGLLLFLSAACLLLAAFVSLIWHFSTVSAIGFIVGVIFMVVVSVWHQGSVQSWVQQQPSDEA